MKSLSHSPGRQIHTAWYTRTQHIPNRASWLGILVYFRAFLWQTNDLIHDCSVRKRIEGEIHSNSQNVLLAKKAIGIFKRLHWKIIHNTYSELYHSYEIIEKLFISTRLSVPCLPGMNQYFWIVVSRLFTSDHLRHLLKDASKRTSKAKMRYATWYRTAQRLAWFC